MTALMGNAGFRSVLLTFLIAWPLPAGSADPGQARGSRLRAVRLPRTS